MLLPILAQPHLHNAWPFPAEQKKLNVPSASRKDARQRLNPPSTLAGNTLSPTIDRDRDRLDPVKRAKRPPTFTRASIHDFSPPRIDFELCFYRSLYIQWGDTRQHARRVKSLKFMQNWGRRRREGGRGTHYAQYLSLFITGSFVMRP